MAPPKASALEETLRTALLAFGRDLPGAEWYYQWQPGRKWHWDCCWPALKVAVECDGGMACPGGGSHHSHKDDEKLATARKAGWVIVHLTTPMLRDSENCVEILRAVLAWRGAAVDKVTR